MIEKIRQQHHELSQLNTNKESVNLDRLQKMGMMIMIEQMGLGALLDSDQMWGARAWVGDTRNAGYPSDQLPKPSLPAR